MKICGLQKTTLLDYPGKIACTVFLHGCNLRCPFCHNASLVLPCCDVNDISQDELIHFLLSRRGKLDGVCVTGGEPTLHNALPELLTRIKEIGFVVKLDTNGTNPTMLQEVLASKLVDYVAMDIKNSPENYVQTCGGIDQLDAILKSADILLHSSTDYEFRTTLMHPLHTMTDMYSIGRWLQGARKYFLQQFVDSGNLIGKGMSPLHKAEMEAMRQAVLPAIPNTYIRGL